MLIVAKAISIRAACATNSEAHITLGLRILRGDRVCLGSESVVILNGIPRSNVAGLAPEEIQPCLVREGRVTRGKVTQWRRLPHRWRIIKIDMIISQITRI